MPIYLLSPSFGGTFGNFRPLSLTTSTCVNPHRDFYHYFERALSPTCEHYNVNEHPRNPSGYFRPLSLTTSACVNLHILNLPLLRKRAMDTLGNFLPLSLTSSACVKSSCLLAISTNRRYFICLCHNEHSRHPSGYFR